MPHLVNILIPIESVDVIESTASRANIVQIIFQIKHVPIEQIFLNWVNK